VTQSALHRAVRQVIDAELERLSREFFELCPPHPTLSMSTVPAPSRSAGRWVTTGCRARNSCWMPLWSGRAHRRLRAVGEDFFNVDRAGALHARRMAKAIVMTGPHMKRSDARVVPGVGAARMLAISCDEGRQLDPLAWSRLFETLQSSGEAWTNPARSFWWARSGHFTLPNLPWDHITVGARPIACGA
jgi:hypothetical protein